MSNNGRVTKVGCERSDNMNINGNELWVVLKFIDIISCKERKIVTLKYYMQNNVAEGTQFDERQIV